MRKIVFPIVLLALAAPICIAEIVVRTQKSEQLTSLLKATIDLSATCYGDLSNAIGVVGDSDGSIVKTLWSIRSIPAVLADTKMKMDHSVTIKNQHRLQVFIVAAESPRRFLSLMTEIMASVWWNHYANFLIVIPIADDSDQCAKVDVYLYIAFEEFGVLNAQVICLDGANDISIMNSNPFTRRAPEPWEFTHARRARSGYYFYLYKRRYQEEGQACEALSFAKSLDLDGYPFYFISPYRKFNAQLSSGISAPTRNNAFNIFFNAVKWLMGYVRTALNAEVMISENINFPVGIEIAPVYFSDCIASVDDRRTYPVFQEDLLAVTQHTGHMTQLEKIISVIDRRSRIGVLIVYVITFLFFKIFLRQAIVPSLLDLVRLTCGQGLVKLPKNVAPTIYLACLLMFVVTILGILTGNLATLLTTNIHYPNVNNREDIANLGYTIYTEYYKYFDDPIFEGRVVKVQQSAEVSCLDYVLRDPLAVCIDTYFSSLIDAYTHDLHLSRGQLDCDYIIYPLTKNNPFGRRLDAIFTTSIESGLRERKFDEYLAELRVDLQNDYLVNQNTEIRVMTLVDLRFAFVILGIGLTCSLVCFIGEIIVHHVRSKIAKRRFRSRPRSAWGPSRKSFFIFRHLSSR